MVERRMALHFNRSSRSSVGSSLVGMASIGSSLVCVHVVFRGND